MRWFERLSFIVSLIGLIFTVALMRFDFDSWLMSISKISTWILFFMGMLLRGINLSMFQPVLAKEDAKRLWIKGLSKEFRDSLPALNDGAQPREFRNE